MLLWASDEAQAVAADAADRRTALSGLSAGTVDSVRYP